ncbi:50S ribosomal protein L18 [Saccharicrinis aurantiacus]|uniref:50S ribosomal protein L18 n=1 Tax=Saccharicrinis aurantiacus TaxID=1849719 RepID=UPI000838A533|nr:50S ribosomal protein L18 [Saccharicrinis aurantiacus]
MAFSKVERRLKIKKSIRGKISGTAEKPRMSVFRSNKQISVQLIDDVTGKTIVAASSLEKEVAAQKVTKGDQAGLVGKAIADKAKGAGIETVVFDRGGYLYHGRVKQLADAAREAGLKF